MQKSKNCLVLIKKKIEEEHFAILSVGITTKLTFKHAMQHSIIPFKVSMSAHIEVYGKIENPKRTTFYISNILKLENFRIHGIHHRVSTVVGLFVVVYIYFSESNFLKLLSIVFYSSPCRFSSFFF